MEIEKELKSYRKRNKYTQTEMAKILSVSRSTYSKYENGSRKISEGVITKINNLIPYLETGNKLDCIYDWVRVRIPNMSPEDVITKILRLKVDMFINKSTNILNYNTVYELDNIRVLYDSPKLTNKGVSIEMSGQGCRLYEEFIKFRDQWWFAFFRDCAHAGAVFNRIDMAINDYYRFIDIPEFIEKVENDECITKFRTWHVTGEGDFNGKKEGSSIYFGAGQSNLQVVFYEKDYEQAKKQRIPREQVEIKNRYELRFKHEYAQDLMGKLLATADALQLVKNILSTYISFRDKQLGQEKKYWPLNPDWSVLLDDVEELKLEMKPKEDSYERTVDNMFYQYGGAMRMVLRTDDIRGTDTFIKRVRESEMSEKYYHMMKVYLAKTEDFIA